MDFPCLSNGNVPGDEVPDRICCDAGAGALKWCDQMPFDDPADLKIALVLISYEEVHGRALLKQLNASRYAYLVTRIVAPDAMHGEFEKAVESACGQRPVIVFLDAQTLDRETERLAARVQQLQRQMAIACVVTRARDEPLQRARLRALGATVFDERANKLEGVRLH